VKQKVTPKRPEQMLRTQVNEKCNDVNSADEGK
jgi:hypothetical protein